MKWLFFGLAAVVIVGVLIVLMFNFAPATNTVSDAEVRQGSETSEPSDADLEAIMQAYDRILSEERAALFPNDMIITEHLHGAGVLAPELFSSRDQIDRMIETLVKAQAELDDPLGSGDQIRDNANARIKEEADVPDHVAERVIEIFRIESSDPELRMFFKQQAEMRQKLFAAFEAFYRLHRNNFGDFEIVRGITDDWEIRYSANPLEIAALESNWEINDIVNAYQAADDAYYEYLNAR